MGRRRRKPRLWIVIALVSTIAVGLGCYVKRGAIKAAFRGTQPVTFAHDVAPIIYDKCAQCHRPGEAAPFSLLTCEDVRKRAGQISEVTQKGIMPPWLPRVGHGDFVGARRLNAAELQTLHRWAEAGAPVGSEADMPRMPEFVDSWQKDPPDLILETPTYKLASDERDVFRNFIVPMKLEAPRWVQAIEIRPCNPRVTHHARLGVDSSNESIRRDAEDEEPGYAGMAWGQDPDGQLVIWAPGMTASTSAKNTAWRLYPNTCLVLHTHMQPSGKPEVVQFKVGIRFATIPPDQHPVMMRIGSCNIDIPAGAAQHPVMDQFTLPVDVDIHTIFPHAHSLCSQLYVLAERPDGTRESLISIDHFDENWHDSYRYRKPVRLPRGTNLHTLFVYDNTDANVRNRNHPAKRVVYGSNANDEMADVYLQVTAVRPDQRPILMEYYRQYELHSQMIGFQKNLELYSDNTWSQEALGACYVAVGDLPKALAMFEKRLQTGPKSVFPVVSLGMAMLTAGKPAEAEQRLQEALKIDPKYPLGWFGLGKALLAQQKWDDAEAAFHKTVQLAPGHIEARLLILDFLIRRNQLEAARLMCNAAISDSPDNSAIYLKQAEVLARQKKYDEGLESCRIAQSLAPYTHPPKVLLAVICCANNDLQRGLTLLQEARAENPTHPMPALMLAQLARQQKQIQPAREYLAAAVTMPIPDNWPPSHRNRFLVLLQTERLQLAQQLQDIEMARDALNQLLKLDPQNAQARKMLDSLPANAGK